MDTWKECTRPVDNRLEVIFSCEHLSSRLVTCQWSSRTTMYTTSKFFHPSLTCDDSYHQKFISPCISSSAPKKHRRNIQLQEEEQLFYRKKIKSVTFISFCRQVNCFSWVAFSLFCFALSRAECAMKTKLTFLSSRQSICLFCWKFKLKTS